MIFMQLASALRRRETCGAAIAELGVEFGWNAPRELANMLPSQCRSGSQNAGKHARERKRSH
jgi:hypothetical protein